MLYEKRYLKVERFHHQDKELTYITIFFIATFTGSGLIFLRITELSHILTNSQAA
ncbi:hypothetical protein NMYAN_20401 [Nitrosomonas nitrosa]|uniref:Uncharacterized protein n=1 Tax=Nitrosomonas nitrosa TaxID=52442 RepID=A0A8H8YZ92_9PROT|nr:hypothetical protein NMYAN_20401 [Nitrosomonas nitrosa]